MRFYKLFNRSLMTLIAALLISACSHERALKPAALASFKPTLAIGKQWTNSVSMHKNSYLKLTPAYAGNKIFLVGTGGVVKALDARSGKLLWQNDTKLPLSSGIGVNDNALFIGTANGLVVALQQTSGRILWQAKEISDVSAAPAASDDIVIVKTTSGRVDAFRAKDGMPLWNYLHQEPSLVLRGTSSPKISGKVVICGFSNGEIVALNINNGEILWQQQAAIPSGSFLMDRRVDIIADPVVSNGVAYVSAYQGGIAAIDIRSGSIIWRKDLASTAGVAIDQSKVYVVDNTDKLWALRRTNGDEVWQSDILIRRGLSTPTVSGGLLIVGDASGYVHWLSASTGKLVARSKVAGSVVVAPIGYDRQALVVDVDGGATGFKW